MLLLFYVIYNLFLIYKSFFPIFHFSSHYIWALKIEFDALLYGSSFGYISDNTHYISEKVGALTVL